MIRKPCLRDGSYRTLGFYKLGSNLQRVTFMYGVNSIFHFNRSDLTDHKCKKTLPGISSVTQLITIPNRISRSFNRYGSDPCLS